MITFNIYGSFVKYQTKQKQLLPYHNTSNKFLKIDNKNILSIKYKNILKMESKDELKEINIKNRTCYYSGNIYVLLF